MKVINVGKKLTQNFNNIRHYATVNNLIIKNKPIIVLKEETEQQIINCMQELAEKRTFDEFNAIEFAKKIILNA